MMRRCLLLLVLLALPLNARAAEVIHSFDSAVSVARDGELTVTETIRVRAEGYEIRRGIYRDFPLTFRDAAGSLHEVTFSLLEVRRDGHAEPYHTERKGGMLRIYAGAKDVIIPHGDHIYVFRYRTGRQIRWFDGKPELNWNVTGNFWHFPILAAHYQLTLPGGVPPVRYTAYTGRLGARGTDWEGGVSSLDVLTVNSTRRLSPGEGLTVVAEIPANAVEPPSASMLLWYQILDNRRWIFGGIGFVLVLGYYLASWNAVGRDPKAGLVIPLFHPPQGVSPALANYIHNWGFAREKWRAFTAAVLSLAVRGLVHVDDSGGKLTVKATGKSPEGSAFAALPAGEGAIVTWLNAQGGTGVIDRAHGEQIAKLGTAFTASIEAESRNRFFRRNLGYVTAGVAMTALVVIGVMMFGGLDDTDMSIIFMLGFAGLVFGMVVVPVLQSLFGGARFDVLVRIVITLAVFGILFSIGVNFVHAVFPQGFESARVWSFVADYPFSFVFVPAFATLNGLFLHLMRAPTALGRPIMDELNGFKLYLETAESDRLNMRPPELTADRFEALLPYAVALDVEKPWSAAFAAALKRAHPEDADPTRHYTPGWYSGGSWSSDDFGRSVSSTVSSVSGAFASAVPVSSGSSGFSGGGGSGGGGGGGGGGGW